MSSSEPSVNTGASSATWLMAGNGPTPQSQNLTQTNTQNIAYHDERQYATLQHVNIMHTSMDPLVVNQAWQHMSEVRR